ncbi:MAG: serine hydrolase domain-containing protein [Saprospiraceae bacterium]
MRNIYFLLLPIFLVSNLYGQELKNGKLDSLFSLLEEHNKFMGGVSIFKNGEEIYQRSLGYVDVEKNIKVDAASQYRIGSISKTFTAVMVLQLIEEGKLDLTTSLKKYFPDVPNAKAITVEQLLRHRSGIFNFTNAQDFETWMTKPISKKELVQKIASHKPAFAPDEKAEYSNSNYVLLSLMIEKITGKDYATELEKRILKPCKLNRTAVGSAIEPDKNQALSYVKQGSWMLAVETDMSIPLGAGFIISSPTDLNVFLNCLFKNKLLKKETMQEMTSLKDGFGLGLFSAPFYDKTGLGHGGDIDGFHSQAFHFEKEQLSISLITNGIDYSLNDIMIGILSIYFGLDYPLPVFQSDLKLEENMLKVYEGNYTSPNFPLDLKIFVQNGVLNGQATGQSNFPLQAYGNDTFRFDMAGIEIVFHPKEDFLILKQAGQQFKLSRK